MSYDLRPNNKECDVFHFGAFSFLILIESFGYLFPCISKGGQWYCVFGKDERMPNGDNYPRLFSNDGMKITKEEALIMAKMAENFVAIQRKLEDNSTWPRKIREDFVDKIEKFAKWAVKTDGFKIW